MNGLSQFLVESILLEAADITKVICVYSGRFQPFHKGHYATYQNLCKKFGSDNVYIATSNVTDNSKSPFDFKDKKAIMTKMFGIPSNKIVQVKNPYAPNEVLDKYKPETTAVVSAVGEKDEMRLGGKYFKPYKDGKIDTGYKDAGYVYAAPAVSNPISGTDVRNWLSKGSEADKKKNFMKAYPKFDEQIFKLITLKLSKFAKEGIYESIHITELNDKYAYKPLSEFGFGTGAAGAGAPAAGGFPGGIGTGLNLPSGYINGAPTGKETNKLSKKLRKKTGLAGYEPVKENWDSDYKKVKCSNCGWEWDLADGGDDPYVCHRCGNDNSKQYEDININVDKGDEILTGKFKNKKTTVKDIGKDQHGMPTINGKQATTFRTTNETIKKVGDNEWAVYPKKGGDRLGTHKSYASALRQLKAIEIHKHEGVEDKIPGGLAKGKTLIDLAKRWDKKGYYDPKQFAAEYIKPELVKGIKVEMEHTTDVRIATEIAMDHLWEDLHYYKKLATIENENLLEYTGTGTAGFNDGNTVTGYYWNKNWDDYDNAKYYLLGLVGWEKKEEKPSEKEKIKADKFPMPLYNHDDSVHKYNRILKYGFKKPDEFLKGDGKSISGTTDAYPNKYDNQPGKDEVINMDPTIDIPAKLRENMMGEGLKDLEKQRMKLFIQALKMMPNSPAQMKVRAEIDRLGKEIQKLQKENINESLLTEGGAYGHMHHPFDIEMNLTFGDLKNIVKKALNGDLETAREKTDGQALAVSWVNGRLVAARNKSHLKNKGKDAMTIGQVATKFAGRGGLTDAYNFAMQDLSKAIGSLSAAQQNKIFQNGKSFMNLEVIWPTSVNVIPYGQPLLVFHGTFEYDDAGNVVGENQQAAKILAGMIKQVNADVQSQYTIQGPPIQSLPKSQDLSKLQTKYLGMISKLQSEFGLSDKDGVADYHQAWWTNFVDKNAKGLDPQQKIGLVKRWAFGDKSFRIADIKDPKINAWAVATDKNDQAKISKQNLMKFEEIFLGVGADVLSFMTSVLTANPDSAKRQMIARLEKTISDVKASGDAKNIAKLELELSRMQALGGFDKIVPNEGLVFVYKGNTYKLTGAFAPLNQILGIFFEK